MLWLLGSRETSKVSNNEQIGDSIHTTRKVFENVALFLRLGLPFILIRHENGAFRKRSFCRRNLKKKLKRKIRVIVWFLGPT